MILIVEDEAISRRALAALLKANGYEAAAVPTAEAALEILHQGPEPEIALIDLDLPGMNGLDLIRQLEQSNPGIYPVLITASSREKLEDVCRQHPVRYLRKPLNFDHLLTVLSETQRRN